MTSRRGAGSGSSSRAHGTLRVGERTTRWRRQGRLDGRPVLALAHGAGAPLTSAFLEAAAVGLVQRGLTVVRFHFPYMQRMVDEERRRPPDRAPVLEETWCAMAAKISAWPGAGPLVLAGKSMGARMASHVLAQGRVTDAVAAVYLGYPLHPPGKPERLRDVHLPEVAVPQLFVSGTRDALARFDLLERVVEALGSGARLETVEGGDHSLATSRARPLEGAEAWLDAVAAFVSRHAPGRKPRRRTSKAP